MMALIRRYRGTVASSKLEYGEVSIDQKTRKAYRQDKLLALNPTTYTILEMLVKSAPDVVTREEIAFQLWQENEPNNDVLRSHIYQLRNELDKPCEQHVLITVPKVGFRLETVA
ncbi:winged helix-turn-helix domain-containing protein, partial [Vibrio parahaemolyticus]|nr:winged helix-turn-helix domain-containing protein [Vibrio parahaemolyticus]